MVQSASIGWIAGNLAVIQTRNVMVGAKLGPGAGHEI